MSRKFLETGLLKHVTLALLPGTILGVVAYTNREAVSRFLDQLMIDESQKEAIATAKADYTSSRAVARKAERNLHRGNIIATHFSARRNYHNNELLYYHMDADPYLLTIQQYDEGLSQPFLANLIGVQYTSPEFLKRKQELRSKKLQKSKETRERLYAELEKKGLIDKV